MKAAAPKKSSSKAVELLKRKARRQPPERPALSVIVSVGLLAVLSRS
jgi:hypothetical protein